MTLLHPKRSSSVTVLFVFSVCLALSSCGKTDRRAGDVSRGVVAAATPEAADAGREILRNGGNAIDAAVAAAFALGVTEPAGSGLGGQTVILFQNPGREPLVINGTSFAPAATPDTITTYASLRGRRGFTVPTTVKTLAFALKHYGSGAVSWKQVLAPAIRYAEQGFPLGPYRRRSLEVSAAELRRDSATAALFLPGDSIPPAGFIFKQPVLARTLRHLAEAGPDDFYHGDLARLIAHDMQSHGGWITLDDLESLPDPAVVPALSSTCRGWNVHTLPPPYGGWTVLAILNLLEHTSPEETLPGTVAWDIALARALQAGHRARKEHPVTDLARYRREVDERLDKDYLFRLLERDGVTGAGETTHLSIVDRDGMVVGLSQSVNYFFGAKVASPDLGFVYNDYMREFVLDDPRSPYALRAGAMPYSSMSATIVARGETPVMAVGSPGSARIISAVVQVVSNWIDRGMDIGGAVAAPRMHVVPPNRILFERGISKNLARRFKKAGFELEQPPVEVARDGFNAYFGGVHAVAFEDGQWTGAADPRRDGTVVFVRE